MNRKEQIQAVINIADHAGDEVYNNYGEASTEVINQESFMAAQRMVVIVDTQFKLQLTVEEVLTIETKLADIFSQTSW